MDHWSSRTVQWGSRHTSWIHERADSNRKEAEKRNKSISSNQNGTRKISKFDGANKQEKETNGNTLWDSYKRMQVNSIKACFDRRLFRSIKVNLIKDESVQSVSTELTTYQICLKNFNLAVDKRTKNNQALCLSFYHHSIENFASIELKCGFDRMNSRARQPSVELTRYLTKHAQSLIESQNNSQQATPAFTRRLKN